MFSDTFTALLYNGLVIHSKMTFFAKAKTKVLLTGSGPATNNQPTNLAPNSLVRHTLGEILRTEEVLDVVHQHLPNTINQGTIENDKRIADVTT